VFDLFRITEQGQADEHWDVMEEIESEAQLASIF
jgi:predicted SnoaL-like aldol condensation-catalyzing enzyme